MNKTAIYKLRLDGVDITIDNMRQLKQLQKEYVQELEKTKIGSDRYTQLEKNVGAIKTVQKGFNDEIRQTQREQTQLADKAKGSYRAMQAELTNLKNEFKELGVEARDGIYGKGIQKRIKDLSNDLKGIDKGLGDNQRSVGDYGKAFAGGGVGGLLKFAGAAGVAIGAVTGVVNAGVALVEVNNKQAQAEAALRQAMGKRVEVADRLIEQAGKFQNTSLIGDEAIIEQQAFLASIGKTEEEINDIIQASLNLAAVTGGSLESGVKNLSKTYSGLSGELGEVLPGLRNLTKEELEAGAAVELVNTQFAGQAELASTVGSGPLTQLSNVWGDLKESVGGFVQIGLTKLAPFLKIGIQQVTRWVEALNFAPAAFAGIKAVGSQALERITDDFNRQILNVKIGVERLKNFLGLSSDANVDALRSQRDALAADDLGFKEAFRNAFDESAKEIEKAVQANKERFAASGVRIGQGIGDGIAKGARSKAEEISKSLAPKLDEDIFKEQLREQEKEAKEQLRLLEKQEDAELKLEEEYLKFHRDLEEEDLKAIQKAADEELAILEKRQQQEIDKELEHERAIAEEKKRIREDTESQILEIAAQAALLRQERNREALQEETAERLAAVDEEFAGRLAAAEGNAEETARINKSIEDEKLKIRKEEFEQNKKISIKEALIKGALAAIQAIANTILPFPASLTAAIPIAAATAFQVGTIASQTFADGGFTPNNSPAPPDRTGHRPAGIVHVGEYVTPKKVLATPRGRALVNQLESIRGNLGLGSASRGYYADGGFAVPLSGLSGGNQQVTVQSNLELTPEFVAAIESAVERGSEKGSEKGSTEGFGRAALENERDVQILEDIAV